MKNSFYESNLFVLLLIFLWILTVIIQFNCLLSSEYIAFGFLCVPNISIIVLINLVHYNNQYKYGNKNKHDI